MKLVMLTALPHAVPHCPVWLKGSVDRCVLVCLVHGAGGLLQLDRSHRTSEQRREGKIAVAVWPRRNCGSGP